MLLPEENQLRGTWQPYTRKFWSRHTHLNCWFVMQFGHRRAMATGAMSASSMHASAVDARTAFDRVMELILISWFGSCSACGLRNNLLSNRQWQWQYLHIVAQLLDTEHRKRSKLNMAALMYSIRGNYTHRVHSHYVSRPDTMSLCTLHACDTSQVYEVIQGPKTHAHKQVLEFESRRSSSTWYWHNAWVIHGAGNEHVAATLLSKFEAWSVSSDHDIGRALQSLGV